MKNKAILLTVGLLKQGNAKTAHGLIRKSSRYEVIAVIDKHSGGLEAGTVIDNVNRNIPVYATLGDYTSSSSPKADFAIVGVALPGGRLTDELLEQIKLSIKSGMSIVCGLHDFVSEIPEIAALAKEQGVELIDIRKPRPKNLLKFWTGEIMEVKCPVIAVLGTDCALGKRTTAVMITEEMKKAGAKAFMIFTGQTGWLQGHKYGFILDSTYNDFISGELENAVVNCYRTESPDYIFLEGQSALSNPSGPCGAEYLLSAQCKGVILQHAPQRTYYNGQEETGIKVSLDREIGIINLYGAEVIALTLNTDGLTLEEAKMHKRNYEQKYKIPVILPLEEGVQELAKAVTAYSKKFSTASAQ